jgi:LSD1 subclass zinc finger protein
MPEDDAEKLYVHLSRPAPAWLRRLGATGLFATLTLVLLAAALVALLLVGPKIDGWLSLRLGARLRDTWDPFDLTLFHAALLLAVASPWLLLTVAERRAAARAHLRAELAAAPPAVAGGARACRGCGAPLVLPDGARGARCPACRADNLILGSDDLQRRVAHRGNHGTGPVADARTLAAWESVWLRRSLMVRVGLPVLFFLVASAGELLTWRRLDGLGFADRLGHREAHRSWTLPVECKGLGCAARLPGGTAELPLRGGERLRLRVLALPGGDDLARVSVHLKNVDRVPPQDWPILADSELRAGEDLVAQAPFTGWYAWSFEWQRRTRTQPPPCAVEYVIEPPRPSPSPDGARKGEP